MSFLWPFPFLPSLALTAVVVFCALFATLTSDDQKSRRAIEVVKLLRGNLPRSKR
ncbi:hypothetical protein OK074_5046 [Actinobacteria bacterium OK074]|nr:hypothetical protein OK074_5046 [Actinobacteria bacterium OK074]